MTSRATLIIGAGGGIGSALFSRWQQDDNVDHVIAVSRTAEPQNNPAAARNTDWLQCDYSATAIADCCNKIKQQEIDISRVCICNGILHTTEIWPEKRLEELDAETLLQVFTINTITPMMWLQSLLPVLQGRHHCVVSVFNARIGSIGDNRLGGWYSYRASKAALNMLLKTAAIEFARRAKNVKLISFHPGTTDTALSRPFHHTVAEQDLLSADFVARCLIDIMNDQHADGTLSYLDWENKPILW